MTQHKHTQHSNAPHSASKPVHKTSPNETVSTVSEAQEKVLEMGRGNAENLMHTAQTCSQTAGKLAGICSGNVSALVEAASKASRTAQDVAAEVMESSNRTFSDCAGISKEVFACRTIGDMVELQNKAVQQLSDNYFTMINKLSETLFDGCMEAMEPFYERTAIASDQFRRAVAA